MRLFLLLILSVFSALFSIAQRNSSLDSERKKSVISINNPVQVASREISSLKTNGCNSSSGVFYIKKDSTTFYPHKSVRSSDGFLLIAGEKQINYTPSTDAGLLMKSDDDGKIIWAKTYDSLNHMINRSRSYYYQLLELKDGSILLAGATNNLVSIYNDDLLLTKTDNAGNILWSKTYKSRVWGPGEGTPDYFYLYQVKEDLNTGDIYITASHWLAGRSIIKVNSANGNIMWSTFYQPPFNGTQDVPFGIDIKTDEIRSFGKFYSPNGNFYLGMYRINKLTGDTIQTKFQILTDTAGPKAGFITAKSLTVLNNGNYALCGGLFGYGYYPSPGAIPYYQAGVVEVDNNLNVVKSYCFRNNMPSNGNVRLTIQPDGSGLFEMLYRPNFVTSDVYYTQFKNDVILKKRVKRYVNDVPFDDAQAKLGDGGDLIIKLISDANYQFGKIEFLKLHISDTASDCLGKDEYLTFTQPLSYSNISARLASIGYNDFSENVNKTLTVQPVVPFDYVPGCQQVSFCDSLRMIASANALCTSTPLTIVVRKNPLCGTPILFNYDSSHIQSFTQVNDSTYNIVFNSAWKGNIYGSLMGCTNNLDSIPVNVFQSLTSLNLGPDTVLCPGNTILLNAKKGFASYQWQDGSTDSTFTVIQPGTYFVKTTNACGGIFYDTVIVSSHPPIPFDIGPDLSKCNGDSLTITAPSGFLNYVWTPAYNITPANTQTVKLFPYADTMYKVRAEKTPGCFAYDSIRIKVYTSPKIDLGPDKSFCTGDSLVLNAGTGFNKYVWSTGSSLQQIIVKNAGAYSVIATTTQNCNSKDTLVVLSVNPNPIVTLDHDSTLCAGTSKILNAGTFNSYIWNTGSTSQTISVNNTGMYSVTVTDNNNCKGSDSTRIVTILPSPSNFLPADTAICSYGSVQLFSNTTFSKYLWNTNSSASSITITQPGVYWLQVSDKNNCSGRDSITVAQKDCMKGFYIPNAFSPNRDGKNDLFRPMLFGKVILYEFTIFNQWGEIVFKSTDVNKGWDGTHKKLPQDTFVFVWICKYQFESEPVKTERGSVLLLR